MIQHSFSGTHVLYRIFQTINYDLFLCDSVQGAVKSNATAVKDIIVAQYEHFGKKVVLLGHSKGGTDAAAACAMYWTGLKDKVRGLIMLQSPYGGTPLAADLLKEGQFGALNSIFLGKLASFSNPDVSYTFITINVCSPISSLFLFH